MDSGARLRWGRLSHLVEQVVRPAVHPRRSPLAVEMSLLDGEPISPAEAPMLAYQPSRVGDGWGGPWATAWFRVRGEIPEAFHGSHVVALIDLGYGRQPGFGGEALVFSGGRPVQGINSRHRSVEIAAKAESGAPLDLFVEAAANPFAEEGPLEWPLLMPDYRGRPVYRRGEFQLALVDDEMKDVLYDWSVLLELSDALGLEHRRSAEILAVLGDIVNNLSLNDLKRTLLDRRQEWLPLLDRASHSSHRVAAAGHAHIDSAWLWPVRETRRKCARTMATQLALMARYPEYVFVCSQAQQHAWLEQLYPELFNDMKTRVSEGRLEPVGSMWVEPDTNIPNGESLVRQLVYGKRYFLDRYGLETTDCWLPDAFGYTGSLPQILRAANVTRFLTQKLSWNEIDPFPHHTFWWEGIDGSTVLAHCPPANTYNGDFSVAQLVGAETRFAQHGISSASLYPFGYGDGGGGPTEEMLERARRMASLDPIPPVTLSGSREFFDSLEREIAARDEIHARTHISTSGTAHSPGPGGLPIWSGELYLEKHRGVQTTQARGKLGNRVSERLLREAELWAAVALRGDEERTAREQLSRAWESVLLHQFHDILPGSSIHWVHEDALTAYADVADQAGSVIENATRALVETLALSPREGGEEGTSVVVLNAATHPRDEVVEIETTSSDLIAAPESVTGTSGAPRPVQQLGNGRAVVRVDVPGSGWNVLALRPHKVSKAEVSDAVTVDGLTIANGLLSVTLDDTGRLVSLRDHVLDREVVPEGEFGNVLQLHRDLPRAFDAWDVDEGTFERAVDQLTVHSVDVSEAGPVRGAIRVVRPVGEASELTQQVRLSAGSRLVEFVTEIDWKERHSFLKVAFPVAVRASHAVYEIQFGHIERPTAANTSWDAAKFEVPAQRWAALSEPGLGVALLNDCKHGYDIRRNVMRLSLLRGPGWPDPDADVGQHRFSYGLFPFHPGSGPDAVVAAAEAFNMPLRCLPATGTTGGTVPARGSFVTLDGATLSAVKRADDASGDLVVRLYEHNGAHGSVMLQLNSAIASAERVDLLERPLEKVDVRDGTVSLEVRPFELVSLRLRS